MLDLSHFDPLIEDIQKYDDEVGACFYPDRDLFILYKRGIVIYKIDLHSPEVLKLDIRFHMREARKASRLLDTLSPQDYAMLTKTPLTIGKKL